MAGSISSQANFGSFLPTTSSWEIQQIQQSTLDPKLKEILVRLYQTLNNIVLVTNTKDSAIYDTEEFLCGQLYFPVNGQTQVGAGMAQYRQIFRKVVEFGPLPNATSKAVAHNIPVNAGYLFTRIYGTASRPDAQVNIPIPFATNLANQNVEIGITNTEVAIITAANFTAYTTCYVVIEYIKN